MGLFPLLLRQFRRKTRFDPTGKADGTYDWDTGQAGAFVVSGGYASWVPTLGSDILTDGGVENWVSPTDLTSWLIGIAGASTANREATAPHGGTYAVRMDIDASNNSVQVAQGPTTVAGRWYQIGAWIKADSGTPTAKMTFVATNVPVFTLSTAYQQFLFYARADAAATSLLLNRNSAASKSLTWDDITVKAITLSTMLQLVNAGSPSHRVRVKIHALPANGRGGAVVASSSDATSNVKAYLVTLNSVTRLIVTKRVSGTVTVLRTITTTFAADAELSVSSQQVGSSLQIDVVYNGVLLYTGTITDAAIVGNTYAGPMVTDSSVTLGLVRVDVGRAAGYTVLEDAAPAAPTLVLGAELFANTGFDADTDWLKSGSWTIGSGVATQPGGNAGAAIYQSRADAAGAWYQISVNCTSFGAATLRQLMGGDAVGAAIAGTGISVAISRQRANANCGWNVDATGAGSLDDASLKLITLSSILTGGGACSVQAGEYGAACTVPATHFGGFGHFNDDYSDGWYVYHDRTNVILARVGVSAAVLSVAATYSAGAELRVVRSGTSFDVFYNGSAVGTTVTIAGLATLTQVKAFSTDPTVSVVNLFGRGVLP